jgi:hypothetical protein
MADEKPPTNPEDAYNPKDFYRGSQSNSHSINDFDETMWEGRNQPPKAMPKNGELSKTEKDEFFSDFKPEDFKPID